MSAGFVYVLSNPSMPGIVKIGRTIRHPSDRASELYKTASGVPDAFHVETAVWSEDCEASEADVRSNLKNLRVNLSREFFRVDVDSAVAEVINCAAGASHSVVAVESDRCLNESFVMYMAHNIGITAQLVCEAIESMERDDVEILVRRVADQRAARIAAFEAKIGEVAYEH